MNLATEIDLGPLTWVKGEVDLALQQAGDCLEQYAESADSTRLKFCRTHVHQVHGALAMLGLDGVTALTEALEALLLGMEEARLPAGDRAISALRQGLHSLQAYLDDLASGAPNQTLRLWPAYQTLAGARGLPAPSPSDLFFPDLSRRPPRREHDLPVLGSDQMQATLKAARGRFQKGLLSWLKKPDQAEAGRQQMSDALATIEAVQPTPAARAFWWVALGLLHALAEPRLGADPAARQLCSRIDVQIRRLLQGSHSVAERLMREALYYIAQAPAERHPAIAAIQSGFDLAALLPGSTAADLSSPHETGLRKLREVLTGTEEVWSKCCTGQTASLPAFAESARACAQLTAEIGQTDLKRLGQGLAAMACWLAEDAARFSNTVAMEAATAILLLQGAQENFKHLGTDFAQQVDLMVARLYACIAGRPAADEGLPLLDEVTRRAQEKLLIGQVGREIQSNLAQIEQVLDAFFRDTSRAAELAQLDGQVRQISGALVMLGHLGAVAALRTCAGQIQQFARADYVPAAADFERVAHELSVLGFFVDALQAGETSFEAFVDRLSGKAPAVGDAEEADVSPAPSVEAQLVQQARDTQVLAEALRESPDDPQLQDQLKQNLQAIQKDADLVANRELGDSAKAALAALQAGDPVDAALSALTPATPEIPAVSAATRELAEAPHATIDAELLSIFLEEAREVLTTLAARSAQLADKPNDNEALTTIRRSTHTLKGSGRMVGLSDLGNAAWEIEQTLNLWLRQDQAATPELVELLEAEHRLFSTWVEHLETGHGDAPDPGPVVALARRLRGIESPDGAVAPQAAPQSAPQATPQDAPPALSAAETVLGIEAPPPVDEAGPLVAIDTLVPLPEPETPEARSKALSDASLPPVDPLEPDATSPSPTLYDIFREEARGHLQTLIDGHATLDGQPGSPTPFEMTRAAHTLGGIAATVGLMPLHHLAIPLEHALMRRDHAALPDSIEGLETVRQAIITLQEMFDALARQHAPAEAGQLVAALDEIYPPPLVVEDAPAPEDSPLPSPAEVPDDATSAPLQSGDTPAMDALQASDELDEQLLPLFVEEGADLTRDMTAQLANWRNNPAGEAAPHALARLLHTFKGSARMAGAMNLGEATHRLEARVEEAQRAKFVNAAFIDDIEAGCDALAQSVERLRLAPIPPLAAPTAPGDEAIAPTALRPADSESEAFGQSATLRVRADLIDRLVGEAGELSIARTRIEGEMRHLKGSMLELTENVIRLRRQLREIEIQAESQMQARVAQAPEGVAEFDPLELDRFTRFQELTRFMAESVNDVATVQQSLLKNLDDANAAVLAQARLNRSLQQELMGVRMLPFASQTERLYRIVRQTAKETGKRARLDIIGGQVDIDRSVLDKMLPPIEHMLRNAVTHGIEDKAQRLASGKPEAGEIVVKLAQEGNEIILSMSDDGGGLNVQGIRARAEAIGLLPAGQAVDDATLYDFIFQPGFSTASALTQLSGRGVGMDVVKTAVSELGGRIEIESQAGAGTSFHLYLPLTLAVTQTVLVRAGSQLYALPSTMIEQVMEMKESALAVLRERGEVEWQGNRYPFHFLPHLLGDPAAVPEAHRQYWVLLLRSGAQRVGVLVDEIRGNQEVVVKNIGAQLARVVGIAGATVLGDGRVVLILNPVALASRATPAAIATSAAAVPAVPRPGGGEPAHASCIMVVDDSLTVRKITSRLLMREGYQVILARDGVDALEQLADISPRVILSDVEMPRMDGFDLVRNIRADKRLHAIPIVMITSRTADKHRNYALEIGANHYLGKPYDETELLSLVAHYCKTA